ncbi:hypothetical protein VTL71DRAFT_2296 [Oculimacula yallundae]|uniref:Uncharacterized protein n=1 Tax=Oculimacula yallundae TaxID=86028 RepID=A0ABR4C8I1_9HELO
MTVGVPGNCFDGEHAPAPLMRLFESALEVLSFVGANLVVNANLRAPRIFTDSINYLGMPHTNPNNIHSVEDIIVFIKTAPNEEYLDLKIGKPLWTQAECIDVDSDKYKGMVEQELYFGGVANNLAANMGLPVMSVPPGFYPMVRT